jgi:NAD(P)-dependent dehydrogenase (short-subunit alcohol dehydrogenase family)
MTLNVLVTGASRGIGKAAAVLSGARGWNVGVNSSFRRPGGRAAGRHVKRRRRAACL